jgi:hypothetical protein
MPASKKQLPTQSTDKKQEKVVVKESSFNKEDDQKKTVKKAGRTLLVSPNHGSSITESSFKLYTGLAGTHVTKNNSYFLTFDTIDNALECFNKIKNDLPDLKVKFARYQIFFTVSGLTDTSDYSVVKQELSKFIEKTSGANVLYFKLYRKGDNYIGCGDLTVDTKDSMDKLINKESTIKNYSVVCGSETLSGTFYRYNKTQDQNNNQQEQNDA